MTIRISHTEDQTAGEIKAYTTLELEFGDDTPSDMVKFIIRELLIEEPRYELAETFDLNEAISKHSRFGANRG